VTLAAEATPGLPAEGKPEGQSTLLVSTFYLRDALFALDTGLVEEVVRLRRITRVAHAPGYVLGIMNLRGKIVTVLDLAEILQLGRTIPAEDSRLYIVSDGDGLAGLLVDRAADVIELESAGLEQPPASVRGTEGRFFQGIARAGVHLVAVLDLAAVLSVEAL